MQYTARLQDRVLECSIIRVQQCLQMQQQGCSAIIQCTAMQHNMVQCIKVLYKCSIMPNVVSMHIYIWIQSLFYKHDAIRKKISAGEDPKQYGRKDKRDTCYSTMFVMVSCRLGKIKPRKISCCCCRFDVLLFLFVLCRHAHCEVTRRIYQNTVQNAIPLDKYDITQCLILLLIIIIIYIYTRQPCRMLFRKRSRKRKGQEAQKRQTEAMTYGITSWCVIEHMTA